MQPNQTEKIIYDHISGQISVAPEHLADRVLRLMRKGRAGEFEKFKSIFDSVNGATGKKTIYGALLYIQFSWLHR